MTLSAIRDALTRVNEGELRRAVSIVQGARKNGKTIFFIGNGGSAAIASHMAADFLKAGGMVAQAFNDAPLMSCVANDIGYGDVFAVPLVRFGEAGDVLFAISSSGRSENIQNAVTAALYADIRVVTLSGFTPDNPLKGRGEVNFYVDSNQYGVVEVSHHAICHTILDMVIDDAR